MGGGRRSSAASPWPTRLLAIALLVLAAVSFAALGFIAAIWATTFEQVNFFPTFIITPLTFLGGVFYSVSHAARTALRRLTLANPVFYVVDGVRFGMLGISDASPWAGALFLVALAVVTLGVAYQHARPGTGCGGESQPPVESARVPHFIIRSPQGGRPPMSRLLVAVLVAAASPLAGCSRKDGGGGGRPGGGAAPAGPAPRAPGRPPRPARPRPRRRATARPPAARRSSGRLPRPGRRAWPHRALRPHGAAMSAGGDVGDVKVPKATGQDARTVAELYAQRTALKDRTVTVRGKVVKFTPGVMGKNWIHLRDGTGTAGKDNDVTVTTQDPAAKGDVVLVQGQGGASTRTSAWGRPTR